MLAVLEEQVAALLAVPVETEHLVEALGVEVLAAAAVVAVVVQRTVVVMVPEELLPEVLGS